MKRNSIGDISMPKLVNNSALEELKTHLSEASSMKTAIQSITDNYAKQMDEIIKSMTSFVEQTTKITDSISQIPFSDIFKGFHEAGLTPNLGECKSIYNINKFKKVLDCGYAIFWIPRSELADQIVLAKSEKERKSIIVNNEMLIIDDCVKALKNINKEYLEDYVLHLEDSISSMRNQNYRSAQSAITVCVDSLIDKLIKTDDLSSFSSISRRSDQNAKDLKKFDNVPIQYLYAALQARLITFVFRGFNRLKPNTVSTKYSRHSSTHSVSKRQYKKINALQGLMLATSLLVTTDKLGEKWLTELATINIG